MGHDWHYCLSGYRTDHLYHQRGGYLAQRRVGVGKYSGQRHVGRHDGADLARHLDFMDLSPPDWSNFAAGLVGRLDMIIQKMQPGWIERAGNEELVYF